VLGVHPNTVRAWSDRGVIPALRINARGDRRYRRSDLTAFLGTAASRTGDPVAPAAESPETPPRRRATWAAQLQSIQFLGARLSRLTSLRDIGDAIASELHRLIDYHNVRVYSVAGTDLVPVAWQGQIGEYFEETEEQLRLTMGQGITGWVAEHGVPAYLPDAAHDPRVRIIPGTEADLPESLLVVPTIYEERVIGVIVLSKLGLHQFTDDDLRLLVIYASFAAQAMANAATTEQLRDQSQALARQLRSQRELLALTESLLTSMDARAILEAVGDSLGTLVPYDNLGIETFDPATGCLHPIITRGTRADFYSTLTVPAGQGVTGWVFQHGEAALVRDMLSDSRVMSTPELPAEAGSIIVVPIRGRSGMLGVIYMERLGDDPNDAFDEEAFDLTKLFAAHASIALQNAELYSAAETRARTDGLTGLMNQTTFKDALAHAIRRGDRFSLIYLDLDDFGAHNKGPDKHQLGDDILRSIAHGLQRAGRESDHVYRYGGDEFTLLLPNTDASGAHAVARKVARAIRRVAPEDAALSRPVTASIGVATFPEDGDTEYTILLAADRASSAAKERGGNRVISASDTHGIDRLASLTVPTPVESEPEAPAAALRREVAASIAG
jgi:diguanylate cyclase (GGDEF)-like protein